MNLTYEAIDAQGNSMVDTIEAPSQREATDQLRGKGLFVTRISEQQERRAKSREVSASDEDTSWRLPVRTLALFTRQMAMLLNSGSAVVPAVAAIRRQIKKPKQAAILGRIVSDLEEGVTLTDALRRWKRAFDPVYCAIIAAGEASGTLGEMFERLAVIVGKRRAMRGKIIGAMIYPLLLITMSLSILMVLLLFVLPRFNDMFVQLAVEPPATTKMLLSAGAFLRGHWMMLLAGLAVIVGSILSLVFSDVGRKWLCNVQLAIPGFGTLRSRLIQGQVFRTMGTLLTSRVGLLDTLELAREATQNNRFQDLFDRLEEAVTSGGQPSTAFEASGLVQPYICQAVRTGEDSGSLGEALAYCADVLDESNTELVNTMTRLIEPAILIVMGFLVGGVAISLFLPLFDMTSAIG